MRVGEGEYAFLVSPPIPSSTLPVSSRDILSKVFKTKEELTPLYQKYYKTFEEIQERLKPVVQRLQRLDPNQERFLYPIFMDRNSIGDLPEELKKDGVTEETKHTSYYLFRGGPSFDSIFGDFFLIFRNIAPGYDQENESEETRTYWLQTYKSIYTFLYPIAKKVEALTRELYKNQIQHMDLHGGNVLLNFLSPSFETWIQKTKQFIINVKESPDYRILKSILGKDCLLTCDISYEQRTQIQDLLDDLKDIDTSDIKPVLIDWDISRILEEEDDDTGDLIYHLVPLDSMVSKFWKDMDSM